MFSNLGEFENGQVKISGANRLRVNAAAEAMGISKDEMFNMINRQAVRSRVEAQAKGVSALEGDEELKELVLNTATLNKEGQAVVNVNGQQKTLDEMTSADKKYLQDLQKTESEDIKDIAQILRGYTDVQEGFTKEVENKKAQAFQNIGKATKMIYDRLGQSNVALEIIKDAFLAQVIAGAIGSIGSGFGGIGRSLPFGRGGAGAGGVGGGGAGGVGGGAAGGGGSAAAGLTPSLASRRIASGKEFTSGGQTYKLNSQGTGYLKQTASGKWVNAGKGGAEAAAKTASASAKLVGGAVGGALAGATTALGYIADGSFKGSRDDKSKAIGGTVGSALLGGLGTAFLGPIGGMIGAEIGKFAGEWVGKKISGAVTKARSKKKDDMVKALGGEDTEKGKAMANLKGDYSKKQLEQIKKALADGKIGEGELSDKVLKKMAQSGDKDLIEQFGTKKAKEKMNEQIEKINAKVDKGNFNMETGEFSVGNANFGMIEPIAMAKGGKLNGPSDIGGPGMPIQGTNIVVGGGEYVVNAEATKIYEPLLDKINSSSSFKMASGGIMPTPIVKFAEGGKLAENVGNPGGDKKMQLPIKISNILPNILKSPMAPLPVRAAMGAMGMLKDQRGGIDKMEVGPIKLEVSGTIKLDSGGKQVDLDAIMNNPAFLTQLSQMIERRLSDNVNGGNFKETRKNKRHNF